ncbi:hypothetical protein [Emticicia sp. W12TSBA100-4]|uniref:hypothetical protein n=1 Tax=Emticicia sp. W12TSBA100-4 TaxID=3160965 RepID=UPI0033069169
MAKKSSKSSKSGGRTPDKRTTKSPKLKAAQNKFAKLNKTAFELAHKDGQKGNPQKSVAKYYKDAKNIVY